MQTKCASAQTHTKYSQHSTDTRMWIADDDNLRKKKKRNSSRTTALLMSEPSLNRPGINTNVRTLPVICKSSPSPYPPNTECRKTCCLRKTVLASSTECVSSRITVIALWKINQEKYLHVEFYIPACLGMRNLLRPCLGSSWRMIHRSNNMQRRNNKINKV